MSNDPIVQQIPALKDAKDAIGNLFSGEKAAELQQAAESLCSAAKAFPSDVQARNKVQELEQELVDERAAHNKTKEEAAAMKVKVAESTLKASNLAAQLASYVDSKNGLLRLLATLKAMKDSSGGGLYSTDELKAISRNCVIVDVPDQDEVLAKVVGRE